MRQQHCMVACMLRPFVLCFPMPHKASSSNIRRIQYHTLHEVCTAGMAATVAMYSHIWPFGIAMATFAA